MQLGAGTTSLLFLSQCAIPFCILSVHPAKRKVQERQEVRRVEEEAAYMTKSQEVQQEWRRSSVVKLRKRAEVLKEAHLLEFGWQTLEVVVSYLTCEKCGSQGCHVEENRGQGMISRWKLEKLQWYGCKGKKVEKVVYEQKTQKVQPKRG